MSQVRSNSSYAISAIEFNSKSLNPISTIQPTIIAKIKREADGYSNCAERCRQIWQALAKNDIAGSHLTQKVLEMVFKQFQNDLYTFTKIASLKEFMKIFDEDRDGCLNPDEQIQIFSFIKQRLQIVANNCLQIQAYVKFQNLMKEVRTLEGYIAKWQQILRSKIHGNQLNQYHQEGDNRVQQFCDRYDKQFEDLQLEMVERRQKFQKQAFYQAQMLEDKLGQSNQYLKIKPNNRIKQLQVQEKLVSLEERVYEALDYRKQLNELEVKEKERVDKLMMEHADQQRYNLRIKHQKNRKELQIKLQQLQNKLIIKMKKEFQVLKKKNNLHEIQIRRLHGLEHKWAAKKGLFEPQLKRTKKLKNQRNEVLEEFKKSLFGISKISQQQDTNISGKANKLNAKSLLSATTKFQISNRADSQIPININSLKPVNIAASKIDKYVNINSNQKSYSLCKLYDNNLKQKQIPPILSQAIINQQKTRKYNFIMSKII